MGYNNHMKTTLLTLATLIILFPDTTFAQGIMAGVCEGTTCSACHIAVLANTLIDWLIGVILVLFAVLVVVAGFGLVTAQGNPAAVTDAKSKFTNAFIGLLIVLSAWIVVDTLMRALVGGSGEIQGFGPWSSIECGSQSEATTKPGNLGTFEQVDIFVPDAASTVTSAPTACSQGPGGNRTQCAAQIAACAGKATVEEVGRNSLQVVCETSVGIIDPSTRDTPCDVGPGGNRTQCRSQVAACEATPGSTAEIITANPESFRVACFAASPTSACNESDMTSINLFGFNTAVAKSIVSRLGQVNADWVRRGGNSFYRVYSVGAYNCRRITGGSGYSVHAYALAVDINPRENAYVKPKPSRGCPTDMTSSGFHNLFINRGFGWGGNWRSACDAMHFSAARNEGGWIDL